MAVQMQVAFSARFAGVGAIAGGPYLCAEGSLTIANLRCLEALPPPDAGYLWRRTLALRGLRRISTRWRPCRASAPMSSTAGRTGACAGPWWRA